MSEIIGRDDELASLHAFVDDARERPSALCAEDFTTIIGFAMKTLTCHVEGAKEGTYNCIAVLNVAEASAA